jgi:hypothetical protein
MCARVKMLTAINSSVNCTLVLIKHKYSKCIHRILSLPRVKCETAAPANLRLSAGNTYPVPQKSQRCGMAFNSRCLATSLQPGATGKNCVGQLTEAA